jgi:hypothetical protein
MLIAIYDSGRSGLDVGVTRHMIDDPAGDAGAGPLAVGFGGDLTVEEFIFCWSAFATSGL